MKQCWKGAGGDGWKSRDSSRVPDLPGSVAVGETPRGVVNLIRESIQLHIRAMREVGETVPLPCSTSTMINGQTCLGSK
jgi:predicted RNase H-like HicB family nuclease